MRPVRGCDQAGSPGGFRRTAFLGLDSELKTRSGRCCDSGVFRVFRTARTPVRLATRELFDHCMLLELSESNVRTRIIVTAAHGEDQPHRGVSVGTEKPYRRRGGPLLPSAQPTASPTPRAPG